MLFSSSSPSFSSSFPLKSNSLVAESGLEFHATATGFCGTKDRNQGFVHWTNSLRTELHLRPLPLSLLIICFLSPGGSCQWGPQSAFAEKMPKVCSYTVTLVRKWGWPSISHFREKESEVYNGPDNSLRSHTKVSPSFMALVSAYCLLLGVHKMYFIET